MSFEDWAGAEISLMAQGNRAPRPGPHQSLFKYVGLDSPKSWDLFEQTLSDFTLSGSTPKHLNDPFELSPSFADDLGSLAVAEFARSGGSDLIKEFFEERDNSEEFDSSKAERYRQIAKNRIEQNSKYARIISFCRRLDSPLLWSHYANKYEGACIQFLGKAFPRYGMQLGFVEYSSERPIYPYSLALKLDQLVSRRETGTRRKLLQAESDKITYFNKSQEWSYEQEARIVYNANRQDPIKFDPVGLVSIVLGPRIPDRVEKKLRAIVQTSSVSDLTVRRSRLSKTSFAIEFE